MQWLGGGGEWSGGGAMVTYLQGGIKGVPHNPAVGGGRGKGMGGGHGDLPAGGRSRVYHSLKRSGCCCWRSSSSVLSRMSFSVCRTNTSPCSHKCTGKVQQADMQVNNWPTCCTHKSGQQPQTHKKDRGRNKHASPLLLGRTHAYLPNPILQCPWMSKLG